MTCGIGGGELGSRSFRGIGAERAILRLPDRSSIGIERAIEVWRTRDNPGLALFATSVDV
ncbi:MAG: hypothetical protein AB7T19_00285 [Planctomycetota bacterium]